MPAATLLATSLPNHKLWEHPNPESTKLYKFKSHIASKYGASLDTYHDLHRWSTEHIPEFWAEIWNYTGVKASQKYTDVVDSSAPIFPRPPWFSGAKLNFAENLLFPQDVDEEDLAVIAATEEGRERVTWAGLRASVRRCAAALTGNIAPGDRVAGYVGNHMEALVAMLATTSLGGIWSGISPDHGSTAVLDRWQQLEPTVLFADNAVFYNGRAHESVSKLRTIVDGLPTLKTVVVFQKFLEIPELEGKMQTYGHFIETAEDKERPLVFKQLDADWPVYILFSSGTTGKPKCIVHGAIGTLIQHKKEHALHCDIGKCSVFFQFTTVTWMMWHWLVSGLASGATIVLYDGSPFRPLIDDSGDLAMSSLIEEFGVTHFGTSAKYLSMLEQNNASPKTKLSLKTLQAIYSTASVLPPSTFNYVYRSFGPNINLGSITGGTDIISLFGAPCPLLPVYSGEIQCIGLGMSVTAFTPAGTPCPSNIPGDLVATKVFPCMPVSFFGPSGAKAYERSYFTTFPGVWHHGDFVKFSAETGGMTMLGRSDGILKPAGVRFGSAEIYNLLQARFPSEVVDALCIGRRREGDADESVVLFVLAADGVVVDDEFRGKVRDAVKKELSARHVPAMIDKCEEIPVTTNGKKVEVAVKQILCGWDVEVGASVANRECLQWYREWAKTH